MRRRWPLPLICAMVLVFAQACWGGTSPATSTPATAPTAAPGTRPAPTAIQTPTETIAAPTVASTAAPGTTTPAAAAPTRTSPASATPPGTTAPTATPTEVRLGLNPPGTPVRPGTPTPTTAPPVVSGREATIAQVQGTGPRSPLVGQTVRVKGIVTADFQAAPAQGFFIQDPEQPKTEASTGVFVYQGDRATPDVKVGDEVVVIGVVAEFNERTEIDANRVGSAVLVNSSGNQLPPPIELRPPPLDADARAYFERYEGMLVSVPRAVVVGPTSRFGEFTVIRADSGATRLFANDPKGAGWRIVVDDEGGVRYDVAVGDQVDGLIGPLDYSFGQFKVQQLPEQKLVQTPAILPQPGFAPAGPGELTVASFNLENLFDPIDNPGKLDPCDRDANGNPCAERVTPADYALKLTKAGQAIRDILGAPTLVAVQEVESLDVLNALAATPELAPNGYGAVLLEGFDPRGIDVGLLYRRDRVTIESAMQRNACTTENLGFTDMEARCSSKGDGVLDGYYLAARPPLLVTLTARNAAGTGALPLTLIINHFKAKSGTDPEGKEFVSRRTAEARLVAGIVNELLAANPNVAIMVVGDLNDAVESEPLRVLTTTTPLRDLALDVAAPSRYSYTFNGQSQVLDHILVTANLKARLTAVAYLHLDADYPSSLAGQPTPFQVSDHDPPIARFRLGP
jgi:predicted extracellular nuclease